MRERILISLYMAVCVGVGFYIPDYFNGVLDRANIAVPITAFGIALLTMTLFGKEK
jgi:hypothetical protein